MHPDHKPDPDASPINPLPPVVVALIVLLGGTELVLQLGSRGLIGGPGAVGWRSQLIQTYGFSPQLWDWALQGGAPLRDWARLVTYPIVHLSATHAVFVVVLLAALGKFVGEVLSGPALLAVFFAATASGAVAYGSLTGATMPLLGGYPGVYGLIGAFTCITWMHLGLTEGNRWQAFQLIGFLMAFQLILRVLFGGGPDWVADLVGFGAGFLLTVPLAPGGGRRLAGFVDRMRRR